MWSRWFDVLERRVVVGVLLWGQQRVDCGLGRSESTGRLATRKVLSSAASLEPRKLVSS